MRQALGIRYLAMVMLVLFLAGCTETYAYLPSVGSKGASGAEAQPAATQPGPTAEAPTPAPKPDLPQQVQALETRVQQLESRVTELESRIAAPAAPGQGAPGDVVALQGRLSGAGDGRSRGRG